MHNHTTGELHLDKSGNPIPRPKGSRPPCELVKDTPLDVRRRACAKVSPESDIALNSRNLEAFQHYRECKATGHFPNDPIVRENAAIIGELIDEHRSGELARTVARMLGLTRR